MVITAQFCIRPIQQSTYRYKFVELVHLLIHITKAKKLCGKIYHIIHYIVCMFIPTLGHFQKNRLLAPTHYLL